ncbi:hypothetical protein GC197_10780 [bacterium]|nr:hypothetical protein [bacterium]
MLLDPQFDLLVRAAAMHHRSLPTYLTYAKPWVPPGEEAKAAILEDIAADHHQLVERMVEVLEAEDRAISLGDFPMEFTDLNDLSLDYVLAEVTRYEQRLLEDLEKLAAWSEAGSPIYQLIQTAIGMAKGHLDNLAEATGKQA